MDSLHEIRIAWAGLKGGRFIAPQEGGQIILLGLEGGTLQPGPVVLQVAPDPRARVPLGALWGQEEQTHIRRAGKRGGGVRPTGVHHEAREAVGDRGRQCVDAELAHRGVPIGPRAEAPVTRRRLPGAIDIAPREDLLERSHRRHPPRGEASAAAREAAAAAFIWAAHAYRMGIRGWDAGLQACPTRRLERGHRLRGVWCDWGGPLCAWP
jgi:hypothetical protein